MTESFVDLTYRGLALGRRIKLAQVRPTTGYLELPMPMPVGTRIAIATDDGVTLDATVIAIYEQIGGADPARPGRVPGMRVAPVLASEPAQQWWQARVTLPTETDDRPPERSRPLTVRPRSQTAPQPPKPVLTSEVTDTKELSVYVAEQAAPAPDDAKPTMMMPALEQEQLVKQTVDGDVIRTTGEHEVVDDGMRTTVMDAVDPAALGLEVTASGSFRAAQSGPIEALDDEDGAGDSQPTQTPPGGVSTKKRRKKR